MLKYWKRTSSLKLFIQSIQTEINKWKIFWKKYHQYLDLVSVQSQKPIPSLDFLYPCLNDDTETTYIEPVYFYQDSWAFEHIVKDKPSFHVDVGSHHKFVALLSRVVPVTMVDIRPLSLSLESLDFKKGRI